MEGRRTDTQASISSEPLQLGNVAGGTSEKDLKGKETWQKCLLRTDIYTMMARCVNRYSGNLRSEKSASHTVEHFPRTDTQSTLRRQMPVLEKVLRKKKLWDDVVETQKRYTY